MFGVGFHEILNAADLRVGTGLCFFRQIAVRSFFARQVNGASIKSSRKPLVTACCEDASALGSLLRVPAKDWEHFKRMFSQKSFDFVLVKRGWSFAAAAIELDDKTHLLPDRKKRDKFINDAGRIRIHTPIWDMKFRDSEANSLRTH